MTDRLIQPWTPEERQECDRLSAEVDRAMKAWEHACKRLDNWIAEHPTVGWMDPESER